MDKVKGAVNGVKSINWSDVRRNTILMAWIVSGIAVFAAPIVQWSLEKRKYYKAKGYYIEYEEQQRQYEEQQNGNNNNNNGNYYSYYRDCGWWNVACQRQQMKYANYYMGENNQGEADENGNYYNFEIPSWFVTLSGGSSEEMRRWKEENTGIRDEMDETAPTTGEIVAVVYMFVIFALVFIIGFETFYKSKPFSTLKWSLAFLIQMCLINLFLLPSLISNEDRMWDDSIYGWYGQIGVLMAYFDFWVLIFSTVFLVVVWREEKKTAEEQQTTSTPTTDGTYTNMI